MRNIQGNYGLSVDVVKPKLLTSPVCSSSVSSAVPQGRRPEMHSTFQKLSRIRKSWGDSSLSSSFRKFSEQLARQVRRSSSFETRCVKTQTMYRWASNRMPLIQNLWFETQAPHHMQPQYSPPPKGFAHIDVKVPEKGLFVKGVGRVLITHSEGHADGHESAELPAKAAGYSARDCAD